MKYLTVYAKETYEVFDEGIGTSPFRKITGSLNITEKLYKQVFFNDDYDETKENIMNSNEFKTIINKITELTEFYQNKNILNNIENININDNKIIISSNIKEIIFTNTPSIISELEIILEISNKKEKDNLIESDWL